MSEPKMTEEQALALIKGMRDPVFFAEKILGFRLWEQQKQMLRAIASHKRVAVRSGHKVSKLLAVDTEIPTPSGFKTMGELSVGDEIFDGNGEIARINAATPALFGETCYRVTLDEGSTIVADANHLWNVQTARDRKQYGRKGEEAPLTVMTTRELLDGGVDTKHSGRNYAIPTVAAKPKGAPLPIDPYILGVWLGDGHSDAGCITSMDQEVWDGIEASGGSFTPYRSKRGKAETRRVVGLTRKLRLLGVKRDKHIPEQYLFSSEAHRRALLAGLMDTDGHVATNGTCFYTGMNERLVRDVWSLAASLGFKPHIGSHDAKINGRYCGQAWQVTFTPHERVFTIARKADRQHTGKTKSQWTRRRYIVSIEPVGSVPVRCVSVDSPTHTFLATRTYVQTHNSHTLSIAGLWWPFRHLPDDARVAITAASFSQVKQIIWREMKKMHAKARKMNAIPGGLGGMFPRDPQTGYQIPGGNEIFGFSTNEPERAAGISSPNLLYLIDEASGVSQEIFEAMEGNRAAGAHIIMTSNPTRTTGTFFDAFHSTRKFWHTIHIPSTASPNITGEMKIPGLATEEWVEEKRAEWGEDSPMFQVRVMGNFPGQGSNAVIGLSLVVEARNRRVKHEGALRIGVDPARYGDDETVISVVRGLRAYPLLVFNKPMNGLEVAGEVLNAIEKYSRPSDKEVRVKVDEIGLGASPVDFLSTMDRAKTAGVVTVPVNVSRRADEADSYYNLRSQLCFNLKEWLEGGGSLPEDEMLTQEMVSPTYSFDEKGRRKLDSKDKEKKILGRSPDRRNALELAVYEAKSRRSIGGDHIYM